MGDAENTLPPSKKRAAGVQLSRDNPGLDDDEDTNGQETGTFKKASDEVLASRRIVKVCRQPTSATPSAPSNPFAGIRLVPPTNICATSAEVTTAAESRKSDSKEVEEKNGMNMETVKGKDEDDKKPESKVDEARIESTPSTPSNPFAGIRLVPPTNFCATSAEVTTAAESRKSYSKEVEEKNGMNMETEKGKYENDKKPESKVDEAGIESTAEKEKSETDKGRDENDKKLESKVDEPGTESTSDKENNDTVNEATKPELADVKTQDGEKTWNEAKTDTDEKRNENEEKRDSDYLNVRKDGVASPFSSFQQLSSGRNAFTGLIGSGFSSSTFTFGPISNDGSCLGSGVFGSDGLKNGYSSLFSNAGTSIANKSEGSGIPSMQEVTVETGEENEKAVFTADSVLFEFLDGGWKERGKGEIKVNVSTVGMRKARLVMRARGNYRLILNASLYSNMKLTFMEKKGITFACVNSNGEGKEGLCTFALKFKDASIAEEFREIVSVHKGKTAAGLKTPENSP